MGRRPVPSNTERTTLNERIAFAPTLADELALTERCLRKNLKSAPRGTTSTPAGRALFRARRTDAETESHFTRARVCRRTQVSCRVPARDGTRDGPSLLDLDDRNARHGWGYRLSSSNHTAPAARAGGAPAARLERRTATREPSATTRTDFDARSRSRSCDRKRRSRRGLRVRSCGSARRKSNATSRGSAGRSRANLRRAYAGTNAAP